jgi:hypothetical protein
MQSEPCGAKPTATEAHISLISCATEPEVDEAK